MIKELLLKTILFLLLTFSFNLFAETLNEPRTVHRVFSEGESSAGFYSVEGFPQCKYGIMYLSLATEAGKAHFSMLLMAKASSNKVVRIDYAIDTNQYCKISGLHIQ